MNKAIIANKCKLIYIYILFKIITINLCYNNYYLFLFKRLFSKITDNTKISKYSKQYKQEYKLTKKEEDAIIGIILAYGSLEKYKPSFNTRLSRDHTFPKQELYVLAIRTIFATLIAKEPVIITRKADLRTRKFYKYMFLRTLSFSCLNKYYDLFYKNKIKVVPDKTKDLLTTIGLAHLLAKQGDGYLHNGTALICSESFTLVRIRGSTITFINCFGLYVWYKSCFKQTYIKFWFG